MAYSTQTVQWETDVSPLPLALSTGLPVRAIWFPVIPSDTTISFADHATGDVFYEIDTVGAERIDVPLLGSTGNPITQVDVTASPSLSSPLWVAFTYEPWAPFKQALLSSSSGPAGSFQIQDFGSADAENTASILSRNGSVVLIKDSAGINAAGTSQVLIDALSVFTMTGASPGTTLDTNGASLFTVNGASTVVLAGGMSFLVDLGAQFLATNAATGLFCQNQSGGGPSVTLGGSSSSLFTIDGGTVNMDVSWDLLAIGNTSGAGILTVSGTLNLAQTGTNTNAGVLLVAGQSGDATATLTIAKGASLSIYTSIASGSFESSLRLVGTLTISGAHPVIQDAEIVTLQGAVLANYTYVPTSLSVAFTDTSYADGSFGAPTGWSWNFGDSGTSTSQNPTHVYASGGTYTVVLTTTTSGGKTSTCTRKVTVS